MDLLVGKILYKETGGRLTSRKKHYVSFLEIILLSEANTEEPTYHSICFLPIIVQVHLSKAHGKYRSFVENRSHSIDIKNSFNFNTCNLHNILFPRHSRYVLRGTALWSLALYLRGEKAYCCPSAK